jgi:hypothetical protein
VRGLPLGLPIQLIGNLERRFHAGQTARMRRR